MNLKTFTRLLVVGAFLLGAWPAPAESSEARHRSYKWWQAEAVRSELGLTADQATRIERLFQATLPDLRTCKRTLDQEQQRLSRLMQDDGSEELEIERQVDRVEDARSLLSKTRTLMLFRIRRLLSPEQRRSLDAIHARSDRGSREPHDP